MKKAVALAFCFLLPGPSTGSPQVGTAFTYQGRLTDAAAPANGTYDLEVKLFDALTAGGQIGITATFDNVTVESGLFTVSLDFGASAFAGDKRWLEIGVRPGASSGAYATLSPRQELTPSPNAVFSATAGSAATALAATSFSGSLSGEVTGTQGATVVSSAVATNTTGAIVRRDGSGDFAARSTTLSGNLTLATPSAASTGVIMKGANRFIHDSGPGGNTFIGESAGNFTLTGNNNIGVGRGTLGSDTAGSSNTAVGDLSMNFNTTGISNTAVGRLSLFSNTTGQFNTALGAGALQSNTTGTSNSASGRSALFANTVGSGNTATGSTALTSNLSGVGNTANGQSALSSNTGGNSNTATGQLALVANTSGSFNTAVGNGALQTSTTASNNIALGVNAGMNLTTGGANIDIGHAGVATDSNTIRIGTPGTQTAAFIAGIRGATTGANDAVAVLIDSNGQLGTVSSSRRYKENIADMGRASDRLMALRPVTFRYRNAYDDGQKPMQFGLVAEEVAETLPELVVLNQDGQPETVKYQDLTPMLLNEVQKQHRVVETQAIEIASLKRQVARLAELEERVATLTRLLNTPAGAVGESASRERR